MPKTKPKTSKPKKKPRAKLFSDLELLWKAISPNGRTLSTDELLDKVRTLKKTKREYALSLCKKILKDKKIGLHKNDYIRVAVIGIIVAALSHSAFLIESLINKKTGRNAYEIQFTLFRLLGWTPHAEKSCPLMLTHVRNYLLTTKYDTAQAAWMAADLLGDHWPLEKTLPVLLEVVKNAKYVAGRDAALYGLTISLTNLSQSSPHRKQIIASLNQLAEYDPSSKIRTIAAYILESRFFQPKRELCENPYAAFDYNQTKSALTTSFTDYTN